MILSNFTLPMPILLSVTVWNDLKFIQIHFVFKIGLHSVRCILFLKSMEHKNWTNKQHWWILFLFFYRNTMHLQNTFACVKKEATPPALNISGSLTTISTASSGNSRTRCSRHSGTWKSWTSQTISSPSSKGKPSDPWRHWSIWIWVGTPWRRWMRGFFVTWTDLRSC